MSNSNSDNPAAGLVMILGLIMLVLVLIELIKMLIIAAAVFFVGYSLFLLYEYNQRTGNITRKLEHMFLGEVTSDTAALPAEEDNTLQLPSPNQEIVDELRKLNDKFDRQFEEEETALDLSADDTLELRTLEQMEMLAEKVERMEAENHSLRNDRQKEIRDAVNSYAERTDKKNKKDLLDNIFEEDHKSYSRSDEFEKQEYYKKKEKETEEFDIRKMKHSLSEQFFEQDKKIYEYRDEAKQDRDLIRNEMRTGFLDTNYSLLHLEKNLTSFKGLVSERFAQVEINFFKAISAVQEQIGNLRVEVTKDLSGMKLQFGKEILRIDKQQLGIIAKMEEYQNRVKSFAMDIVKVKLDAEKFAMNGQELLNRANTVHQRHKADMQMLSKDLEMGLQKISMHENDFANKVGQAKLMMDEISNDQYFALKDMAYERIGVNMLRQEHQQKEALEEQRVQSLIREQRHLEEKIKMELSHGRSVESLNHQLYMKQENLWYANKKADLMRQEFAVMRRLMR